MVDFHRGFQDVDSGSEDDFFVAFLDAANTNESLLRSRQRMVEMCPIVEGHHVLDVGCGLGHEARRLVELVSKDGRIIGLDSAESLIAEARRRTQSTTLPLTFEIGDVHQLHFPDGVFDLVRAERVLLYVENPLKAVREMARVVRPAGHVIVFDFDYHAYFLDSNHEPLTRRIEGIVADDPPNPLIGRQLPYLFRQVGLNVERIAPYTINPSYETVRRIYSGALENARKKGRIAEDELEMWWHGLAQMEQDGSFYHAHPGYIVVGKKV